MFCRLRCRYAIIIVLFLTSLFILWHSPAFSAQPSGSEALTRFIKDGVFDPQIISEDKLAEAITTAYRQETDPLKLDRLAERLLLLKWWNLWDANVETAAETVLVGDPLERTWRPSENWQWSASPAGGPLVREGRPPRVHSSVPVQGVAQHSVKGVFPEILPVHGTLRQYVYWPDQHPPEQITLRLETGSLLGPQQPPVFVQARWTQTPEQHLATENRPQNFWAGALPLSGEGWHELTVNLLDLGLCGENRIIRGIEYIVAGGQAWFGPTVLRRPQVEIRGTQKYQVFAVSEPLQFDLAVHNFAPVDAQYTLRVTVSDYNGAELLQSAYHFAIPGQASRHETLTLNPGRRRYFVFEYTLSQGTQPIAHGYSAAAVIVPNRTGRKDQTPFGMMYWNQPGQDMVALYEKLGVKLIIIFPELPRLHLFDRQKFTVMPMLWALPERSPAEAAKLPQDLHPYLEIGQHLFSNFWETDLRVPAEMFALNMQRFYQIVKQVDPLASVGIGGLAEFNVAYLTKLLQAAPNPASPGFDFITMMLYNTPAPPEFSGMDEATAALHNVLDAAGKSAVELWNVEWSYFETLNLDTGYWLNTSVPQDLVAPYTIRHHLLGFAAGLARMAPGTNIYAGRTPLAKNYGHSMTLGRSSVIRYDLTPLPLLPAYSVMTRMLEGKRYVANLGSQPNIICQVYQAADESYQALASRKTVIVLWTLFGVENITLPLFKPGDGRDAAVTLLNMVGDETERATYNGALHLSVSPEPTYLLLNEDAAELLKTAAAPTAGTICTPSPEVVELAPDQAATVTLTYHLSNPGWNALQGALQLTSPNWIDVLRQEIHYPDDVSRQLAAQILAGRASSEIWLGRQRSVDVAYEIRLPADRQRQTYYEQTELTGQSEFPLIAELQADGKVLAQAATTIRVLPPLSMTLRPVLARKEEVNAPRLAVSLQNNSLIARQGTVWLKVPPQLQVEPPQAAFDLPAGKTRTYEFALQGQPGDTQATTMTIVDAQLNRRTAQAAPLPEQRIRLDRYRPQDGYLFSFGVGEGYVIEALARDRQGYETRQSRGFAFRPAVKAKKRLLIDGNLDDWVDAMPLWLNPEGRLSGLTFFAKDYGGQMQWTGPDDFSAAWQMMWDEAYLYLAVRTYDDVLIPKSNLASFWNGDTLSFQIDPLPELTDAGVIPAKRDLRQIHTFDVGLSKGGPNVRRKYATPTKPAGAVSAIKVAINPLIRNGLIYEIAIPWAELAPLQPEIGGWMGFSMVFYEDDGAGRETRINWFGGSGGNGLAREPRLMGDVHFVP